MATPDTKSQKSMLKSLIELVLTVAIAVGLALLIQAFIVKPYRIPARRWSRRSRSASGCSPIA